MSAKHTIKAERAAHRRILVTGGAGFIGSHTLVALQEAGYPVTVLDNLSNSCAESLRRVTNITGVSVDFYNVDLRDDAAVAGFFEEAVSEYGSAPFAACIHFAALKAVGESIQIPLAYYTNNVTGTVNLLRGLESVGCKSVVFSSSATVYGDADTVPIPETAAVGRCTNAYGRTKFFVEGVLQDVCRGKPSGKLGVDEDPWRVIILRYFNPVGAHVSGTIGEESTGIPNNLMPYITQVAAGRREFLSVYGSDWKTADGTGVRDYIHVVDLAAGHEAALTRGIFDAAFNAKRIRPTLLINEEGEDEEEESTPKKTPHAALLASGDDGSWCDVFNLGSGQGTSVLDMVAGVSEACGHKVPFKLVGRRAGDIAECYADASKAAAELGWCTKLSVQDMCRDAWRFQEQNPHGYGL